MKANNKIITLHNKMLKENREIIESIVARYSKKEEDFKPTQPIPLSEYCHVRRPANTREMILDTVKVDDIFNHPSESLSIPKMSYPKLNRTIASVRAFMKEIKNK